MHNQTVLSFNLVTTINYFECLMSSQTGPAMAGLVGPTPTALHICTYIYSLSYFSVSQF